MSSVASFLSVKSIENLNEYPRVEITAEIVLGKPGIIETIDTDSIREQILSACDFNIEIRAVGSTGK